MRISLGTMQMGSTIPFQKSQDLLKTYYELGHTKIDTAQMYPVPSTLNKFCLTEEIIGDWLSQLSNSEKDKIMVSTKFPNFSKKLNYLRDSNERVISYDELKNSLNSSLERLNLPAIDIYFIHWPSRLTNNFGKSFYNDSDSENQICEELEETYSNLLKLKDEGLCKKIGVSNETSLGLHSLKVATSKSENIDLYIQNSYNILNPTLDINIKEFCLATGIKIQAHSPLAFGVLTGKYQNNQLPIKSRRYENPNYFDRYLTTRSFELVSELQKISKQFNINIIELSYRFLLNNKALSEIVVGVKNKDQLNFALASINKGILPESVFQSVQNLLTNYGIVSW